MAQPLVEESHIQQYKANVIHLAQQEGSLLFDTVGFHRRDDAQGEALAFERIGKATTTKLDSLYTDTPYSEITLSKRWAFPETHTCAHLIDPQTPPQTIVDLRGAYVKSDGYALGRKMDDIMIAALLGSATAGKAKDSSVALPSGQKVAHGSAGLTKAKLMAARKLFYKNQVNMRYKLYCLVTDEQIEDLLGITEVTSADYAAVKALVEGKVTFWMGFWFIPIQGLPLDGDGNRQVIAYSEAALGLGVWRNVDVLIERNVNKNGALSLQSTFQLGAVRVEEEQVVEIACVE